MVDGIPFAVAVKNVAAAIGSPPGLCRQLRYCSIMDEWKPIRDVMTSAVETIDPDALLTDAAAAMIESNVGSLVTVDEDDHPIGILTRTDIVKFVADPDAITGDDVPTVGEMMATDIVTISLEAVFEDAVEELLSNEIHHLPVVDDGKLAGIITTTDLGTVFAAASEETPWGLKF